ncbi:chaperone modulator CbpM [Thermodesulfobacteriota bacterium]
MTKEYWTVTEVVESFQIDEDFIADLEREEIVCPTCLKDQSTKHFSERELDKLRLAKILVEDMDVNLPGVEVILRMKQNMLYMREQFDNILEDLARQIKETFRERF